MDDILINGQVGTHWLHAVGNHIFLRTARGAVISRPVCLAHDYQDCLTSVWSDHHLYFAYLTDHGHIVLRIVGEALPLLKVDCIGRIVRMCLWQCFGVLLLFLVEEGENVWNIRYLISPECGEAHPVVLEGAEAFSMAPELHFLQTMERLNILAADAKAVQYWSMGHDLQIVLYQADIQQDMEKILETLREKNGRTEQELRLLRTEYDTVERKLERLKEDRDKKECAIESMKLYQEEKEQDFEYMKMQYAALREENQRQQEENQKQQEENQRLQEENWRKQEENRRLQKENQRQQEKNRQTEKQLAYCRAQLESAKQQYNVLMDVANRYKQEAMRGYLS